MKMTTPSEFTPKATPTRTPGFTSIQEVVERRLQAGYLTVDGGRGGWLISDIEAVAAAYRNVGWNVVTGGSYAFTFSRPVEVDQANRSEDVG